MKKYIGFCIIILLGLTLSALAFAEDREMMGEGPSFVPERGEVKEMRKKMMDERQEWRAGMEARRRAFMAQLKTDREAFLTELKAKKEEWKAANLERKNEFVGRAQAMIGMRFEVAVRNLERIQTRLEEAIQNLNEAGENTTEAEELLDLAKQKLDDAKDKIEEVKSLLPDAGEKVTPEVFEQIKLGARDAKNLLKESRQYLVEVLKEIKGIKGEETEVEEED